jgi:putative oxidoreductase
MKINKLLIIGGIISMLAALLHIAIIIGGPEWYRFFGAGEGMAQLAESGSTYPTLITTSIAVIFTIWALYAFSGAGIIKKLPLLKPVLVTISIIYLMRGVFGIPLVIYIDKPYLNELEGKMVFMIWSSIISLTCGILYLLGLVQIRSKNCN